MTRSTRRAAIAAPIALTSLAIAQPCAYLYENPAWYTVRAPKSVRAVDLNGDGATDILSVGQLGEVAVSINEGDGTMRRPVFYVSGNPGVFGIESEDVAIGDLNGDGFPDFVTANMTGRSLQVFTNDGAGAFTLTDTLDSPSPMGFSSVAIGDPNGDGRPDIAGSQTGADLILLYLALPGGSFAAPTTGFTVNNPRQLAFGDATGDGLDELFAVASGGPTSLGAPGLLRVYTNLGIAMGTDDWIGLDTTGVANATTFGSPEDLELADMDGDGALDVVVTTTNGSAGFIECFTNAGASAFTVVAAASVPDRPFGLDLGDLNGDGATDVVCASSNNDGTATVILQDTSARGLVTFGAPSNFQATNTISTDADLGDLDGDGDLDVLIGSIGSQMTTALLNDGTGAFGAPNRSDTDAQEVMGLISTDIDGDGDRDIVTLTDIFFGDTFAQVSVNDGSGVFTPGFRLDLSGRPNFPQAGDFDGDGRPDIAALDIDADRVRIVFANGDGTLTEGPTLLSSTQTAVFEFGVLDANGDGRADVFAHGAGINALNQSKLFLGNADRTFTEVAQASFSDSFRGPFAAFDFDGDGDQDLCTIDIPNNFVLLTNNGDSTFTTTATSPGGVSFVESIIAEDFDGDGDGDIAIIDATAREIVLFKGDGLGFTFLPRETIAFDARIDELTAGDADADGDTDIYLRLSQSSTNDESIVYAMGLLLNNGDATFAGLNAYHTFRMNRGIALDDYNGDGALDAAVGVTSPLGSVFTLLQRECDESSVCAGDCDGSGTVNFADLVAMLFEFGTPGALPGCDADTSGTVNFADLVAALFTFGPCP